MRGVRDVPDRFGAVPPPWKQTKSVLVILAPILGAAAAVYAVAGTLPAVALLFAVIVSVTAVPALPLWPDCVVLAAATVAATVGGLLAAGHTGWSVAVVSAAGLCLYVANRRTAGAASYLPMAAFVQAGSGGAASDKPLLAVGLAAAAGVAFAALMIKPAKLHLPRSPVDRRTALRHSLLMAACCAVATWVSFGFHLIHGMWVMLTLCVVFVPTPGQGPRKAVDRVVATVAGGVASFVLLVTVPKQVTLLVAVVCIVFSVAWSLKGLAVYRKTVFWTTPGALLMGGAATPGDLVLNRVVITIVVAAVAGTLASVFLVQPPGAEPAADPQADPEAESGTESESAPLRRMGRSNRTGHSGLTG
ncbi:FUSC family protein [Streptodolium elevatio]